MNIVTVIKVIIHQKVCNQTHEKYANLVPYILINDTHDILRT